MRKWTLLILIVGVLLPAFVLAAPAGQNRPAITSFTTTMPVIDRAALSVRNVRVPVSWTTANRPSTANLVFEQVLPDGRVVNVELPRDNPWVASSGSGIAAPIPPGGSATTVVLRVRLLDLIRATTLDQREITLPIGDAPPPVPLIREFTTRVNVVSRLALDRRVARIPVSWAVDNRPDNSNLVFEQVLPDGKIVNVELPRSNPWVASEGNGVAAPVSPGSGVKTVKLQVRLINLLTQAELAKRDLTLNIDDQMPVEERFQYFTAGVASVSRAALQNRTARVPVSWLLVNRPDNSNLVFEQLLDNGTLVNVELPRSNPWVASEGHGVAAPMLPGSSNIITLVVRLIDLQTKGELERRQLSLTITEASTPPRILSFTTTAASVDLPSLASRSARIPVSWSVENRPDNSNLVFEQVLDNGNVINVELPRSNPWVASVGNGIAAPVGPVNPATPTILLRLRLVNLSNNTTLDTKEITLPIAPNPNWFEVAACDNPNFPNRGIVIGSKGRVTTPLAEGLGMVDNPDPTVRQQQVGILNAGQVFTVTGGPYCYRAKWTSTSGQTFWRLWKVRPDSTSVEGWLNEFTYGFPGSTYLIEPLPAPNGDLRIVSFTAAPTEIPRSGTLTLNWNVTGAAAVDVVRMLERDGGVELERIGTGLSATGSLNYTIPPDYTQIIPFKLVAYKDNNKVEQTLTVKITCPFANSLLASSCPVTQQTVNAAFQTFERGFMVWKGDTRQIVVLYNDRISAAFGDTWIEGETFDVGQPPAGLFKPEHGFGKVWATQPGVRDKLGWATAAESSYSATWETHPFWDGFKRGLAPHFTLPDGRIVRLTSPWTME